MVKILYSDLFLKKFGWIFKQEWEKNLKPTSVMYNARSTGYIDITKVFNNTAEGEVFMRQLASDIAPDYLSNDLKIMEIAETVNKRLRYTNDSTQYGKTEFWQSPYEIWNRKKDDCDGYAVLIKDLADKAGIPEWRTVVAAGYVTQNNRKIGHAYVLYLREKDNQWYTIEGSFYAKEAINRFGIYFPHREAKKYGEIWWTTRKDVSYSKHPLRLNSGV